MTREILFKAKRLDNGEWVEGYYEKYNNQHYINKETDRLNTGGYPVREFIEVDENTICQYTGLTDINDNPILENDIVKFDEELYMVEWSEINACFELYNTGLTERFTSIRSEDCEVIGNKFDNPELIE